MADADSDSPIKLSSRVIIHILLLFLLPLLLSLPPCGLRNEKYSGYGQWHTLSLNHSKCGGAIIHHGSHWNADVTDSNFSYLSDSDWRGQLVPEAARRQGHRSTGRMGQASPGPTGLTGRWPWDQAGGQVDGRAGSGADESVTGRWLGARAHGRYGCLSFVNWSHRTVTEDAFIISPSRMRWLPLSFIWARSNASTSPVLYNPTKTKHGDEGRGKFHTIIKLMQYGLRLLHW